MIHEFHKAMLQMVQHEGQPQTLDSPQAASCRDLRQTRVKLPVVIVYPLRLGSVTNCIDTYAWLHVELYPVNDKTGAGNKRSRFPSSSWKRSIKESIRTFLSLSLIRLKSRILQGLKIGLSSS